MKKSRLTRLFSLFAALMVVMSMFATVASASEIQPRIPTCPNCGGGNTYYTYEMCPDSAQAYVTHKLSDGTICNGNHYYAYVRQCIRCSDCNNLLFHINYNTSYGSGYYCGPTGLYF